MGAVLLCALPALQAQGLSAAAATDPGFGSGAPRVLLMPQRETTLVAEIVGSVQEIKSGLGASFAEGHTLVRFECGQHQARQNMAQAELNAAEQELSAKERLRALKAAGEVEVGLARAGVEKSQAALQLARVQVQSCRVRAPFAGRIVKQHVRQFQGVKVGDPLLEIVAAGPLKLRLNVPSRWLAWLEPKAAFEVRIDETRKVYEARVTAINARVDAVSQSIEIEGEVVGEHAALLAGMSGVARFPQAAGGS